jgi:hypothetical protein
VEELPQIRIYRSTTITPSARCAVLLWAATGLFGSDRGGKTAAVLRNFVTSCELMKIDPFVWLLDVFSRIADQPITKLDELLPHRWAVAHD